MGIVRKGAVKTTAAPATPAPAAAPTRRIRAASAAPAAEPAAEEVQPVAPAKPVGIVTPRARAAAAAVAATSGAAATPAAATPPGDDMDSWGHSGAEAEAMAQQQIMQREREREERRARGYWPRKFTLIPIGTQSRNGPINDRYQADIIVLDVKPSPNFNLHVLRNPKTGRFDVNEPCPKEWDSCPLCPPNGQYDSRFVFLLTVLNINGYTIQTGERMGEFVPITQEVMVVETNNQPFFFNLIRERGEKGLRGLQLTMTRSTKSDPEIGIPSNPNGAEAPVFHSDAEIETFIRENGMWKEKKTRPTPEHPNGEVIGAEDWLTHPFDYKTFVHKPSGADLRQRYGASAVNSPVGSNHSNGADAGQWGGGRYEPAAAAQPGGAAPGGQWGSQVANAADLDDEIPF